MTFSTKTIHTFNGFELPVAPHLCFNSKEVLTCEKNGRTLIGYLTSDQDSQNPLEDSDCYGHIYTAHRHAGREEHRNMQQALGLDDDWEPNLELVNENELLEALYTEIPREILLDHCKDNWPRNDLLSDEEFIRECMPTVEYFEDDFGVETAKVKLKLWKRPKHTVVLDCYQHSGIAYSVQGKGMQCRFDTAKGAAVWVPNDICLEEIHRRAAVYRKGRIVKLKQHWFVEEYGSLIEKLPQFKTWGEAFNYLESVGVIDCHLKSQEHAEAMAAQELALQAVEVYNAYLNGDVYGVVVAQYDSETKELIEHDDCYGFFGYEYAKEELNERINQNDPI